MSRLAWRLTSSSTLLAGAATDTAPSSTKSFNATINRLSSQGFHQNVLLTFSFMLKSNVYPDAHTYPSLFKACTSLDILPLGLSLHQSVIVGGYTSDSYISSSLITFYSAFARADCARYIFDEMHERNVIPWSAIIRCYSRVGDVTKAFSMFHLMRSEGIHPSSVTLLGLLSGVSDISWLEFVHGVAIRYGLDSDLNLGNFMLYLYGQCRRLASARAFFQGMARKDIVSWNSLVSGYAQMGHFGEILCVMKSMRVEGIEPDQQTFGSALNSCDTGHELALIHGHIILIGITVDAPLATSLIGQYFRFGDISSALKVFESISSKDVILWTSMISGLVQSDCADKALMVFYKMLEFEVIPSSKTLATVISACAQKCSLILGKLVHGYLLRQKIPSDIAVQNALITMYAKCGCLGQSTVVFNAMSEKDVVSWNAIVAAYAQSGDMCKALLLFNDMRRTLQRPDSITVVSLLQACDSFGSLQQGKSIHNFVIKNFFQHCILVDTALVDMYSKCGDMRTANKCFRSMPEKDIVSWSTIISGYGSHGRGDIALELFSKFLKTGHQPNHVIFLSVLFACSHNGFVAEGLSLYETMFQDFGIAPRVEHQACMVDLFCRAGRLEDAYDFFSNKISEPNIDILGIILDACRSKGNTKLGEMVARDIMSLKPAQAENFVQLAHIYASMNRWDKKVNSLTQMKSLGLKKAPGWSCVEHHGKISTFFMDQSSHPSYTEMTQVLGILGSEMADSRLYLETSQFDVEVYVT